MTKRFRPSFVKHIIALMLIFGVFFTSLNAFVAVRLLTDYPSLLGLVFFGLYVGILTAIFVCVYGMWSMQRWARKATIATLIAVIISGLPGFLAVLVFYRAIKSLLKTEAKIAFGELDKSEAQKLQKICKKCGAELDQLMDAIPETGELECPKCGWLHKRKRNEA